MYEQFQNIMKMGPFGQIMVTYSCLFVNCLCLPVLNLVSLDIGWLTVISEIILSWIILTMLRYEFEIIPSSNRSMHCTRM